MDKKQLSLLFILVVVLSLTAIVVTALVTSTITNTGFVAALGTAVYSDSGLTIPLSSYDWLAVTKGTPKTLTIYVKNTGNVPITLTIATVNTVPAEYLSSYVSTSYAGQSIAVGSSLVIIVTLNIPVSYAPSVNPFSFDVAISSVG